LQFADVLDRLPFVETSTDAGPVSFFGPSFSGQFLRLCTVSLIVFVGSWMGIMLGKSPAQADVIWPANGLLLGLVLMAPQHRWPSYLGCAALVSMGIHTWLGFPPSETLIFALANTAEVLSAALLMNSANRRPDLTRPRTLLTFFAAAVALAPLLSAIMVLVGEHICHIHAGFVGARDWYLGDALGLGITTPCLLAARQGDILTWLQPRKRLEVAAMFGLLIALTLVIFYQNTFPSAIVFTPLLLLIVFRLGTSGGAVAILLLAGPAAYLTVRQSSHLVLLGKPALVHGILVLQCSLAVLILQVYAVGTVLADKQRVQLALADAFKNVEHLAGIDPLTQLANRRTLDVHLYEQWDRCTRHLTCLSVLMIDIDHFKLCNDRFGHHTGDLVLRSVSDIFRSFATASSGLAARFGGEEFTITLPNIDSSAAFQLAETLRLTIANLHLRDQDGDIPPLTISIGAATAWPREFSDPTQLLTGSDHALYMAKNSGRNKVCVWIEPQDDDIL
jgi:diguanylate cyclase (GGDEF)-like protein